MGAAPSDVTATEVLANIHAMVFGIDSVGVGVGDPITIDLLLELHGRLLGGTALDPYAGRFRRVQNWIGGTSYNPCSAAYVSPPHEFVEDLMADLCDFCNTYELPAVAQAAMAHAQFETIHPFVDGNGRIGQALIHLVLRRRGLAPRVLPPVSLILATSAKDYINGLTLTRYRGSASSKQARAGANRWIDQFSIACTRAVADAADFERRAQEIEGAWRGQMARVRRNSAVDLLLRALLGAPVITVNSAAAVSQLVGANILHQVTFGRRNRAYEAPEIIQAFTNLERELAS
jgi:Fic family protein